MLLRLRTTLSKAELDAIHALASELGYASRFLGERRDLLQLDGTAGGPDHPVRFGELSGVAEILDPGASVPMSRRAPGAPDRVVVARDARFGAGEVSLIAGPCAVEDQGRLLEVARAVRARGATLLRGGAFKPRTSPYSFQGLGEEGLRMLDEVRAESGLGVVTEVLDPRDVERVARTADMLQVGARSMANYALLKELAMLRRPVLLKRGFGATVDELLGAAEYLLAGGNDDVVLCERGIRAFDRVTRGVLDVGAIAHLKRVTHLPIIADPSHAAGRADLVRALGRAGIAAGADGLMVEVHPAPAEVHSDGRQAIDLESFGALARDVEALAALDGRRLVRPESGEQAEKLRGSA